MTVCQAFEDEDLSELDPTLTNLEEGDTYDRLNDDTFGSGALGKGTWQPLSYNVKPIFPRPAFLSMQSREPRALSALVERCFHSAP